MMLDGLLDDLLNSDFRPDPGEIRPDSPQIRPSETQAWRGFSPLSPVSPRGAVEMSLAGDAEAEPSLPESLVRAALRLCDAYGDDEDARARMIEDLKTYPKAQWRWLRDYLNGEAERLEREAARERFEERAVILEFEAGLTRAEAEQAARSETADPDALHRCADCGHAEPTEHNGLIRCGAGREDYPLAGAFWMDDAKVCVAWTPAGHPVVVPVEDDEHAEWVQRMNPKPGK
jgi:hypothetical protein